MNKKALILVDIQNDFLPGGSLPVPEGNQIIHTVNLMLEEHFDLVIATKDWHPGGHWSFASTHCKKPGEAIELMGVMQILWPDHCLQESEGASFAPGWDVNKVNKVFFKGTNPKIDSYSAFFDNLHLRETGLREYLEEQGIKDLYFAGLATDYCVKFSVLDALELGFNSYVVEDACRAVNLQPEDGANALKEMEEKGAKVVNYQMLCNAL